MARSPRGESLRPFGDLAGAVFAARWMPGRLRRIYLQRWVYPRASYVVSHPKSGRTWVAMLLASVMSQLTGRALSLDLYPYARTGIPFVVFTHDGAGSTRRLVTDKGAYRGRRVVLLVRDPRDILVSHYFQLTRRRPVFAGDLEQFIRSPLYGIDWLIDYLNLWAAHADVPQALLTVRYEELHRDAAAVLTRIVEFLRVQGVRTDHITTAVSMTTFERMQEMERRGLLGDFRLRPADPTDPESFKVRRGVAGGYRDYLSSAQLAFIDERIRARLSPAFAFYLPGAAAGVDTAP